MTNLFQNSDKDLLLYKEILNLPVFFPNSGVFFNRHITKLSINSEVSDELSGEITIQVPKWLVEEFLTSEAPFLRTELVSKDDLRKAHFHVVVNREQVFDGTNGIKTVQDAEEQLKPCPWDGRPAEVIEVYGRFTVRCTQCGALHPIGSSKDIHHAIKTWNRRD